MFCLSAFRSLLALCACVSCLTVVSHAAWAAPPVVEDGDPGEADPADDTDLVEAGVGDEAEADDNAEDADTADGDDDAEDADKADADDGSDDADKADADDPGAADAADATDAPAKAKKAANGSTIIEVDGDTCPRVFGDDDRFETQGARRERLLKDVDPIGDVVDIGHSYHWQRPFILRFSGVSLAESDADHGAVFALDDRFRALDCGAGTYRVQRDQSLGEDTAILAVLNDVVLVEFEGELGYFVTRDAKIPTWRMIWLAPWRIIRRRETGVSSGTYPTGSRTRSRRTRRSTRRRR